jgi:cellobiose PTS system EIIA component
MKVKMKRKVILRIMNRKNQNKEETGSYLKEIPSLEESSLQLILHGGNAKSEINQALKASRAGLFNEADDHLIKAEEELQLGRDAQTGILKAEEAGSQFTPTLFYMYAQSYLTSAVTEKGLAEEIIILHKKLSKAYLHFV